jgi:hypothetical protein
MRVLRSRALLLAVALAGLWAARALAPARAPDFAPPGHPLIGALGPLRPFVAELVRLRFESSRRAAHVFGQLDDAWSVLALAPGDPNDFIHFGSYFVIDAPALLQEDAERGALVQAGLEILARGRQIHPASWQLALAEAAAVDHVRRQPEELRALSGAGDAEALVRRLFARCEDALAHAPPRDATGRVWLLVQLEMLVERAAAEESALASIRPDFERLARRLLAEPDLPPTARTALEAALH